MFTPFDAGLALFRAGTDMMLSTFRYGEMLVAANDVIGKRSALIAAGCRDPLNADYAEMMLMSSEKLAAFSQAGSALWGEWTKLQLDFGRAMTSAHSPRRAVRMATRVMGAGGKALAPVHKRATANSRRLKH